MKKVILLKVSFKFIKAFYLTLIRLKVVYISYIFLIKPLISLGKVLIRLILYY